MMVQMFISKACILHIAGAIILPPVPAFYTQPQSIDDLVEQSVTRILDQFGIHLASGKRWQRA